MYSNFKEQAIDYIKQAVKEDNAGNYERAFPLYMNALEYFKTHLKYEKNIKIREAIAAKFTEYLTRAEELQMVLDDGLGPFSKCNPKPPKDYGDPRFANLWSANNLSQAIEEAVEEDNAGNLTKAFPLYMNGIEYFMTHLRFEENPETCEAIRKKLLKYVQRAEELRTVAFDSGGSSCSRPAVAQPKPTSKDGEEVQEKVSSLGMYSNFKEQADECVKEAVKEDNLGNYRKSFSLYMDALEYYMNYMKYDQNPNNGEAISAKFNECVCQAMEIRVMLDKIIA